ncbi:MAG: hypothetical protein J0626_09530 [Rhodospirillaceae bacterium]|nr:hypothetical protein [Rhodospirillaceae bacterium]
MTATDQEFPAADDYGRGLKGFGVNLLVRDVARTVAFSRDILLTETAMANEDFAVLRHKVNGQVLAEWMLHADGTYHANPLLGLLPESGVRGAGEPADKPHGMREAYILDPDGYCWVASMPLAKKP